MSAVFFFLLGILIGGLAAWLLARRGPSQIGRQIESQIERSLPRVAEAVLAPKVQQLERAASQELKLLGADTVSQVNISQAGMQQTLEAMAQRLESYQTRITAFEKERSAAQVQLQTQIEAVAGAGAAMTQEARTLREALSTSGGVRGAWGEEVLKNILNACGLNPQIDYDLQVPLADGDRRLRPDAVIHLPSGRNLVVDAKASLSAFLDGLDQPDPVRRLACFAEFAQVLRRRAKDLAGKEYSHNLAGSLPYVVMFVPSEGAFRAALDADAGLYLYGQNQQPAVLLASPSTLFPLISTIAHGWQQHRAGERMQELLDEVADFGRRLQPLLKHIQQIGGGLDAAGKAYNAALASYRSRVVPRWQHLQEGNAGWESAPELKPVENHPLLADADPGPELPAPVRQAEPSNG